MQTRDDMKVQKIHHPEESFGKPRDVVTDPELSHKEKKKALETLEQDAHQLATASNEGMAPEKEEAVVGREPKLDEIVKAQQQLGVKPAQKRAQ
jgi:hypothetical protein